jgi:hypothetical protein
MNSRAPVLVALGLAALSGVIVGALAAGATAWVIMRCF